jgi:membrane protein required for colicin V production
MNTTVSVPQFSVVDIVVLIVLAYGIFRGARRGLSGELAGLLSVAVALVAGYYFYRPFSEYLVGATRLAPPAANAVAFMAVVMGSYIVMLVARLVLSKLMQFSFKGALERVGGALAGLARSSVVVAIVLLVLGMMPFTDLHRVVAEESRSGRWVCEALGPVYEDLAEKYPALKLPAEPPNPLEDETAAAEPAVTDEEPPLQDVDEDTNSPEESSE